MTQNRSNFGPSPTQGLNVHGITAGGMVGGAMLASALAAGVGNYVRSVEAHRRRVAECKQRGLFLAASEALRQRDYAARRLAEARADHAELALARYQREEAMRRFTEQKQGR